jgi:hypothetical protein
MMRGLYVFLMRAVLAAVFAFVIGRIFFPGASPLRVAALAAALLALAYLFEYTKRKDRGGTHGKP